MGVEITMDEFQKTEDQMALDIGRKLSTTFAEEDGNGDEASQLDDEAVEIPDLSEHHSTAMKILHERPQLWTLRKKRTSLGVSFFDCIQTGLGNRGHPLITSLGCVAGDEGCYDTFEPLFDEVFARTGLGHRIHNRPEDVGLSNMNPEYMKALNEKYVVSHRIRISRSIGPAIRFSPTILNEQRRFVEQVVVRALIQGGDFRDQLMGKYYPLRQSSSRTSFPDITSVSDEEWLRKKNFLIPKPDSSINILAGLARDWPDARGIYVSSSNTCTAWINEEEHLRLVENVDGCDFTNTFHGIYSRLNRIEAELNKDNTHFLRNQKLGFLLSNPLSTGTGLRVSMTLRLELLSKYMPDFRNCARHPISVRADSCEKDNDRWRICALPTLGVSERDQVIALMSTVCYLIRMEQALENGDKEECSEICAALIQAAARANGSRSQTTSEIDAEETKSAVCIQRKWKGKEEKKLKKKIAAEEEKAAGYIQKRWKENHKTKAPSHATPSTSSCITAKYPLPQSSAYSPRAYDSIVSPGAFDAQPSPLDSGDPTPSTGRIMDEVVAASPPEGATKRQVRDFLRKENCRLADIMETREGNLEKLQMQIEAVLGSYHHMKLDLEFHEQKTMEFEKIVDSLLHLNEKYKSELKSVNDPLRQSEC